MTIQKWTDRLSFELSSVGLQIHSIPKRVNGNFRLEVNWMEGDKKTPLNIVKNKTEELNKILRNHISQSAVCGGVPINSRWYRFVVLIKADVFTKKVDLGGVVF